MKYYTRHLSDGLSGACQNSDRIKHKDLIKNLRKLGFDGPFAGGNHNIMVKGNLRLVVPGKHGSGVINDVGLLKRVLRQAGIGISDWEKL